MAGQWFCRSLISMTMLSDQLANYVGNRTLGQVVAFGVGEFQPRNRLPADDALRHRLQYAYIIEFASRWVISHPTPNVELLWQESFVTDRRGIATTIPITNKEEQAYLQNEGWVVLPPQQPGAYFPNINILAGRLSLFYLPGSKCFPLCTMALLFPTRLSSSS